MTVHSRSAILLALLLLAPSSVANCQEAQLSELISVDPKPFDELEATNEFVMFDGFDGKLLLNWHPVRFDETHVSLGKHRGKFTITTQAGTIHAGETPTAKNIFLIANPLNAQTDFVMTTCLTDFHPTMIYQQAGLICYDDDDNYLKWDAEFNGSEPALCILPEEKGVSNFRHAALPTGGKGLWLRLTKRGTSYEFASSTDGNAYNVHGEQTWGSGAPKSLGLIAKNGGRQAAELDAQFEFFELRTPPPARDK